MAVVKLVQPKYGRIRTIDSNPAAYKVEWQRDSAQTRFGGFEVYCEACHHTLLYDYGQVATFDLTSLEDSGHPGPFIFSAKTGRADISDQRNIKLMTNPDDPAHGTTDPNMGFWGIVATGSEGSEFSTIVRVTATPAAGWRFSHWNGGADWKQSQLVRLVHENGDYDRAYTYTAFFTQDCKLTLSVSPAGSGTVMPAEGQHVYRVGDVVTLNATPSQGYRFLRWSDGGEQTHDITMSDECAVVAYFESLDREYTITIHVKSSSTSSVYHDQHYTIHGQGNYKYGDIVEMSVDSRGTYVFDHWEDDGSTDSPRTITVTSSATYVAVMRGSTSVNIKFRINQNDQSGCSVGWISGNTVVDVTNVNRTMSGIGFKIRAYLPLNNINPKYRFLCWEDGSTELERTVYYPSDGMRIVAYFGNDLLMYGRDDKKMICGSNNSLVYSGD